MPMCESFAFLLCSSCQILEALWEQSGLRASPCSFDQLIFNSVLIGVSFSSLDIVYCFISKHSINCFRWVAKSAQELTYFSWKLVRRNWSAKTW